MTEEKKIMIFDDNEEFGGMLVRRLKDYHFHAELISSVTQLDTANTWNNFWDCIVTDVDFEGEQLGGHSIIHDHVKSHHLNCPVIVITGAITSDLEGIKILYGEFFADYLSKRVLDVEEIIITAIEKALNNSPKLALARFKFLFKDLNKLDYVMHRQELSNHTLGMTPREGNTTIEMLIDDLQEMIEKKTIDKVEIDTYIQILWQKYEDFRRGLH